MKDLRGKIKDRVTRHALSTAVSGQKTGHPDDESRLTTRFVSREEAVQQLEQDQTDTKPKPRLRGFLATKKLTFYKSGMCSRKAFRERWQNVNSWYRTTVESVKSGKFWHSVRELLPGESVDSKSEFLTSFVTSVKEEGFMSFDTEREVHPVMSQVIIKLHLYYNV